MKRSINEAFFKVKHIFLQLSFYDNFFITGLGLYGDFHEILANEQ